MKSVYYLLFGLLPALMIRMEAPAQVNPAYRDMLNTNKQQGIASDRRRAMNRKDSLSVAQIPAMGLGDSTIKRLKTIGIDYPSIFKKHPRDLNEKDKTVLSDCVVIGTVEKIERTPQDRHFATIAYVNVEEFLRNDYGLPPGQIPIMIASGPVGGSGYRRWENEDTLAMGEHVLLFLSAKGLLNALSSDTAYFRRVISDPAVRFRILGFDGKYHISGTMAYCEWGGGSLIEMRERIRAVVEIVSPPLKK